MSDNAIRGVVRGNVIELERDAGMSDGAIVEVTMRPVISDQSHNPGDGFLKTEGALADDEEWDEIMQGIQEARGHDRRPQWEEA